MSSAKPNEFLQILQMVILVGAAGAVFLNLGRRDAKLDHVSMQIAELRLVSQDLVKAQIIGSANDTNQLGLQAQPFSACLHFFGK